MVAEDLHSGAQQHWLGHPEEISTLALSHDAQVPALRPPVQARSCGAPATRAGLWTAPSVLTVPLHRQVLASASGRSSAASRCQIRLWDVPRGSCRQLLSHHDTAVQALAFSLDDRLLITLGQWAGLEDGGL